MIQFPSFPHRKIFLTVLALVIVSVTVLVAQNTPPKEAAPSGAGPSVTNVQTDKDMINAFSEVAPDDMNNPLLREIAGVYDFFFTDDQSGQIRQYKISPNGKQVVYKVFYSTEDRDFIAFFYFTIGMNEPRKIEPLIIQGLSDFDTQIQYWLDDSHILFESINSGIANHDGVIIYDLPTWASKQLSINTRYLTTPVPYDNNTKLFYYVLSGNASINLEEGLDGEYLPYSYDLVEKREIQIPDIPQEVQQKIDNKQSFDPKGQNFFDSPESNSNGCSLAGVPTLYLPWPCNKAMLVGRTGPEDCYGSNGVHCTYDHPVIEYDFAHKYSGCGLTPGSLYQPADPCPMQTCGHRRPAIDFGDGQLWLQYNTEVLASAEGKAYRRNQASGAGDYVIMRHDKIGGGYVYTVYMHLSWVDPTIPWGPGEWSTTTYPRGYKIGKEGKTGGQTSEHYHFELRDKDTELGTYYPVFAEYGGCTPKTGRTYISKNVPTAPGSMQLGYDCNSATIISCNTPLSNQSNVGYASRYATYGSTYHGRDETSPERIYKITTTSTGTITASLSNVIYAQVPGNGNDFDVFILKSSSGSCANLDPIDDCKGTSVGLIAQYLDAPAGTYFIIVDGENNSTGSFTLNVTASCGGGGGFSCNNAIPLSNGSPYDGNNTGGGNNVTAYSCQPSWSETGRENVYSYSHTGGNISVNLVETGGADLDAFLLSSCSPTNCILAVNNGLSTSNQPAGTYYIVVDGYNGAVGSYTLTVSSSGGGGEFSCNNAVPLSNGVQYNGNNTGGGNNVTTYNCQSGWSETGPEKVHSYYHTGGTITINLAQSVDVDAFLLGSCSPTNCLLGFDNGVASSSQPAGTYYIVVDGYNGAVGSYTLTVSSTGGGGGGLANDNACSATTLSVGSTCNSTSSTNVGATASTPAPSNTCPVGSYKDVYFKFVIPNVLNPQVTIRTIAGSLTDAVMEVYYTTSTCSNLTYITCEDDNSASNYMPVINLQDGAGYTIWVRVWGWNGGTGTFSICVLNYNSQNFGDPGQDDIVVIDPNAERKMESEGPEVRDQEIKAPLSGRQVVKTCEVSVRGSDITVSNVDLESEYVLCNAMGQITCQGKATDGIIQCRADVPGIYFISIVDGLGNKCVQKVFLN